MYYIKDFIFVLLPKLYNLKFTNNFEIEFFFFLNKGSASSNNKTF